MYIRTGLHIPRCGGPAQRDFKAEKIGHTGTLDPAAEGVLPVCLGMGTRLCDMLADRTKTYEAVLLLGCSTDTQDTTGTILTENREKALALDPETAEKVILGLREIMTRSHPCIPP